MPENYPDAGEVPGLLGRRWRHSAWDDQRIRCLPHGDPAKAMGGYVLFDGRGRRGECTEREAIGNLCNEIRGLGSPLSCTVMGFSLSRSVVVRECWWSVTG